jgi:lipopolysaccharide transport system ATP-binding protein
MSDVVIKVENLTKEYRLGVINHGTLAKDLQAWWAHKRGKDDPNSPLTTNKGSLATDSVLRTPNTEKAPSQTLAPKGEGLKTSHQSSPRLRQAGTLRPTDSEHRKNNSKEKSVPSEARSVAKDSINDLSVSSETRSVAKDSLNDLSVSSETRSVAENDKIYALKDINFEVRQGEVLGIIGANGAGKSTLLKILSRVTTPTSGCVKIKGRIGSLLEVGTGFHPELTGRENIYLNGAILGMKRWEITRKLDEIIDFSGVERFIDTPVKRYSSGMYVRLAFAVAAHLDPEILVIDEVLAVGDAEFQKKCLGKMGDISKKEGRTVLFVSHNMAAVKRLCEKAMVLQFGVLKNIGSSERIISEYLSAVSLKAQRHWSFKFEEKQEQDLQIKEMYFLNRESNCIFSCDEEIKIGVKFKLRKKIKGLYSSIWVSTLDEIPILFSDSRDCESQLNEKLESGCYEVLFTIPKRTLSPQEYFLNVDFAKMTAVNPQRLESKRFVMVFAVIDNFTIRGDMRPGYFSCIIPWNLRKLKSC